MRTTAMVAACVASVGCVTEARLDERLGPAATGFPVAPPARVTTDGDTLHGVRVDDPFRWLEDEASAEVQQWMDGQDAAARARLAALPGRDALAARFRKLFYVDSTSPPTFRNGRYFVVKTHADRDKAIVYVRDGLDGKDRALLDPNVWSKDGTVSLGRWVASPDGKKVVYQRKENAADEATLHVIDVDTNEVSKVDVIPGAKYAGPSWTPDSSGFYYEWLPTDPAIPTAERPGYCELRFHALGSDPAKDPTVHPATRDPKTFLAGQLSKDGRFLFVYVQRGWNENDVWVKELAKDQAFRRFVKGVDATYTVEAVGDRFFVTTDEGAPRRRVLVADSKDISREKWTEVVPEDKDATIEAAGVVGGKLVVAYLKNASSELRVVDPESKATRVLPLPTVGTVTSFTGDDDRSEFFYAFSSFNVPQQVYRADVANEGASLFAKVQLPVDVDRFLVEQVFYPSKDGTRVSMFLVRRKDLARDGKRPVHLYGYGGFDVSLTPAFRASILPWLEAGGIYAVANLRGGGEYGKAWHDAGKGAHKQNVFDDFAAAAEWLVASGWSGTKRIAISGGSNGGLLTGALFTQRPELYGAVVCAVPLLDMVRYHRFGSGMTWIPEYGSADDATQFRTLFAYSPYHHVAKERAYPPLLMLSADHDDRVDPMHARKFVAAVQHASPGASTLLRIERNAGHGGADQVSKSIEQQADVYAFLFAALGVAVPP